MAQQKPGMLSSWKHTLEIHVKCPKKKGQREINRNNWNFPDSYNFHKSTANSRPSSGPHRTDDSWTEYGNQGGEELETGQPTVVIGSLITHRPTATVMLIGHRGQVLLLLILQRRKQPCCPVHRMSNQRSKKADLKSQNAFPSITQPPEDVISGFLI